MIELIFNLFAIACAGFGLFILVMALVLGIQNIWGK